MTCTGVENFFQGCDLMAAGETSLYERLRGAESPREIDDWESRNGYYVKACRVSADDVPGLIDFVRKWTDPDWPWDTVGAPDDDCASDDDDGRDEIELLPVTAWRALADLKAEAAVQPLVDMLCGLGDEFDDWAAEELPHVFGKIGESAIQPLTNVATSDRHPEFIRTIAARGLRCVADYHANTRERIVHCLSELMARADEEHLDFNSTLLVELVELGAVSAAESIERAFAGDLLDVGMMGTWEEVRQRLGVKGLGLEMPVNPYNSLGSIRARMGVGIFSDRPVFIFSEIDEGAAKAYYKRGAEAFSQSDEAQQVRNRHGDLSWASALLQFGVNYRGETVDEMTLLSVQEFVLEHVPRKFSVEADAAAAIVDELTMFWRFLERVYELPEAPAIVEWLSEGRRVARLKAALSDDSNFGMAKSLFMQGKKSGFDMTTEEGIAAFVAAYNGSLSSPSAEASRNQRVGRNDPCPCGSGKKFKKCCGSRS